MPGITVEEAVRGRQARVKYLMEFLEKNPQMRLEEAMARCALATGVSEYTVKRYLALLRKAGYDFKGREDELRVLGL
jgi:hypothetical protein